MHGLGQLIGEMRLYVTGNEAVGRAERQRFVINPFLNQLREPAVKEPRMHCLQPSPHRAPSSQRHDIVHRARRLKVHFHHGPRARDFRHPVLVVRADRLPVRVRQRVDARVVQAVGPHPALHPRPDARQHAHLHQPLHLPLDRPVVDAPQPRQIRVTDPDFLQPPVVARGDQQAQPGEAGLLGRRAMQTRQHQRRQQVILQRPGPGADMFDLFQFRRACLDCGCSCLDAHTDDRTCMGPDSGDADTSGEFP